MNFYQNFSRRFVLSLFVCSALVAFNACTRHSGDTGTGDGSNGTPGGGDLSSNHQPVANSDAIAAIAGLPRTLDLLSNDTDPDGYALSILAVGSPAHGTALLEGNSVIYTPKSNYAGLDEFEYTIINSKKVRSTSKIVMNVQTEPKISIETVAGQPKMKVSWPAADYTNGFVLLSSPTVNGTYTTYSGLAPTLESGRNVIRIAVSGVSGPENTGPSQFFRLGTPARDHTPPVANADSFTVMAGKARTLDPLANDSAPSDGGALSFFNLGTALYGSLSVQAKKVLYTPKAGFTGLDAFSYTAINADGAKTTGFVRIEVANPPALSIVAVSGKAVVSWPANASTADFVLYSSTNVIGPYTIHAPEVKTLESGNYVVRVPLSPQRYFSLGLP